MSNVKHQSDTNVIPTLTLIQKHKKPIIVERDGAKHSVNIDQQYELRNGDKLSSVGVELT